jgi:TorA maturation chaperone TorD
MSTSSDLAPFALAPAQLALARRRAYTLFGHLYLSGITAELLPLLQVIPELNSSLAEPFNADEAAADHQHLFGFNLFPYESIFLDPEGLLGGEVTNTVLRRYQQAGFPVDTVAISPDHLGHELHFLAFLCWSEADAWEDDSPAVALEMQRQQGDFLQVHLLRWLLPVVLATRQQGQSFYVALADLTLNLIHHHYTSARYAKDNLYLLPTSPPLLENEKTGLKEIAAYLMTPVYSGIYLSHDDVSHLARQQYLPRGWGSRAQMLLTLLQSAGQYDTFPAVIAALQETVTKWQSAYADYGTTFPELAPFAKVWHSCTVETVHILAELSRRSIKLGS